MKAKHNHPLQKYNQYFRILGAFFPDNNSQWVLGDWYDEDDTLHMGLMFKSIEGTTEALPQLVLQLYIIARKGLCLSNSGGEMTHLKLEYNDCF